MPIAITLWFERIGPMSDSPDAIAPPPKLSVHDNNIYNYEFDSRSRNLVLRTVFTAENRTNLPMCGATIWKES